MYRLLDLNSAEFVHDGDHWWYQTPPILEFRSREEAELFIPQNIFLWKHRGNFYGIISKLIPCGIVYKRVSSFLEDIPHHQLEIVEVL
jgi:hypothetical protein